jgi:hypothetical protein
MRCHSPSLAGEHHRPGSSSSKTAQTEEIEEEEEGGAPIAEIARSPLGRSRRSSMGEVEKGRGRSRRGSADAPGSPRPSEMVHVISVAAFKE